MKARVLPAIAALLVLAACSTPDGTTGPAPSYLSLSQNPNDEIQNDPNVHVHLPRGQARPGGGGVQLLQYHGGAIMTSTVVKAIYWGPRGATRASWATRSPDLPPLQGRRRIRLHEHEHRVHRNQRDGRRRGQLTTGRHRTQRGRPAGAPQGDGHPRRGVQGHPQPGRQRLLPGLLGPPRGHAGYCAWHSYGTISGVPVQFAFFFDLDGDRGCDPKSPSGRNPGARGARERQRARAERGRHRSARRRLVGPTGPRTPTSARGPSTARR